MLDPRQAQAGRKAQLRFDSGDPGDVAVDPARPRRQGDLPFRQAAGVTGEVLRARGGLDVGTAGGQQTGERGRQGGRDKASCVHDFPRLDQARGPSPTRGRSSSRHKGTL